MRNRVVDLTTHFLLSLGDKCLTGCFPCGPLAWVIRNGSEDISPSIVFSVDGMAANRLDTLASAVTRTIPNAAQLEESALRRQS